ncbi:hypothetical protein, partial [Novipirellula caenicola]|uniref:hypothetical protein n=1 Tax=Novipirellula caenicola TaxID=1536901 RepID=UPI0031E60C66
MVRFIVSLQVVRPSPLITAVIGLTGRLSARLTLLGHGKQTRTMPVVVTRIAKTLAWIVAF